MVNPIFGGKTIEGISLQRAFLDIESSLGKGYIDIIERSNVKSFSKNLFVYDRVIKNIFQGLEIIRLLDDSIQKAKNILIKVKEKIIQATSVGIEERKTLQGQINELIRNLAHILYSLDFNGRNPYKGDTLVIQYGDNKDNFLVINGDRPGNSDRALVVGIIAGKNETSQSVITFINKGKLEREKVALWAYDGTTKQAYRLTLNPQETIFCIVSFPEIPLLPPTFRPCPQYIQLTFFVATTNNSSIQKSLKNTELAIEYFNEIGGFWAQFAKTLQNNLELYLSKKDNLSFFLSNLELRNQMEKRISQLREYFMKEMAIKVYTNYYSFNKLLFDLLFS